MGLKRALSFSAGGDHLQAGQKLYLSLQSDLTGFRSLSRILKELTGIELPENQKNLCLMATRLHGFLQENRIEGYAGLARILASGDRFAIQSFVASMTTHTTHFFREDQHFSVLKQEIPKLIEKKTASSPRELRVWCAAASTGQEPYSIAITLLESLPNPLSWDIKFLATDIDEKSLRAACRGMYTEHEANSMPPLYRQKYLRPLEGNPGLLQISPSLRKMIRFAPLNLAQESYPFKHPFDIVFCRNVLIYFETQLANQVVRKLVSTLGEGGLLFLGHSEAGAMTPGLAAAVAPSVYRKQGSGRIAR